LGLALVDVEAGPRQGARLERVDQGGFVHHVATGGIDQEGFPAHQGKALPVHQVVGFWVCGTVQRNEIRTLEDILELGQLLGTERAHHLGWGWKRVMKDDFHTEATVCPLSDRSRDTTHPY